VNAYASLRELPARADGPPADGVIVMVPASESASVVADCVAAGVKRVWLHRGVGPGSASPEAIALARARGLALVEGECPLMFLGGGIHAAHGAMRRLAGRFPEGGTRRAPLLARIALVLLHLLVGASAFYAGAAFIADPSGAALGMSTAFLAPSPFSDYLVPGLVLLAVNGVGQLACGVVVLRRRPGAARYSFLFGLVLAIWIVFHLLWVAASSWLQPAMLAVGLAQMALALVMTRRVRGARERPC